MTDQNKAGNDLDLSSLNFGPSWARDEGKKEDYSKYEGKDKSAGKGQKGRRNTSHSGGRNQRTGGGKSPRYSGGGDQRRSRGDSRRDGGDRKGFHGNFTPAPEGFTGQVMPIEEGLDRLAKQIIQTSRTYSVFDLARMVLDERNRFNIGLVAPKGVKMFRNTTTSATFLTKEEALADFWASDEKKSFYREVKKEVEAPKGNFSSVARCTKSGVYLGPPNHHDYQKNMHDLHRERFSNVPFEVFQRWVEVLHEEEAVSAWLEQQKFQTYYLPGAEEDALVKTAETITPSETEETPTSEEEPVAEEETEDTPPAASTEEEEAEETLTEGEDTETPTAKAEPAVEEVSISDDVEVDEAQLLKTRAELERHFLENHFQQSYKEVQISWVPSAIPAKSLSPALLSLLKNTISEERRYPGKLSSLMCRQLSGRNVAVYKFNKKLKAGPSRPHALPELSSLAERPKAILEWTLKNNGKGIDKLWESVLPKDVKEEEKAEWFHDLKWLLTQGFLSLLEDGKLFFSKKEKADNPPEKKAETPKKAEPKKEEAAAPKEKKEPVKEAPKADAEVEKEEKK